MRVAIMGTGGVGGYFGGRLAAAGHNVWFIARGEHLEAIRRNGLQVNSALGDFRIFPVQASADPASVGVVDVAIVSVKTWQLPEAAATMAYLI
jgi:2-dehydropantoate 2-reductase